MNHYRWLIAVLAMLSTVAPARSSARSAAQDVADISTSVCFELASGGLVWRPRNLQEETRQIEAAGLTYGVPGGVIDRLGTVGQALVNRATLASRTKDGSHIILARGGTIAGCRVLLVTNRDEESVEAVEAALVQNGWLRLEAFTDTSGAAERRLFVRIDNGRSYGLRLAFTREPSTMLRLFTTVDLLPSDGPAVHAIRP